MRHFKTLCGLALVILCGGIGCSSSKSKPDWPAVSNGFPPILPPALHSFASCEDALTYWHSAELQERVSYLQSMRQDAMTPSLVDSGEKAVVPRRSSPPAPPPVHALGSLVAVDTGLFLTWQQAGNTYAFTVNRFANGGGFAAHTTQIAPVGAARHLAAIKLAYVPLAALRWRDRLVVAGSGEYAGYQASPGDSRLYQATTVSVFNTDDPAAPALEASYRVTGYLQALSTSEDRLTWSTAGSAGSSLYDTGFSYASRSDLTDDTKYLEAINRLKARVNSIPLEEYMPRHGLGDAALTLLPCEALWRPGISAGGLGVTVISSLDASRFPTLWQTRAIIGGAVQAHLDGARLYMSSNPRNPIYWKTVAQQAEEIPSYFRVFPTGRRLATSTLRRLVLSTAIARCWQRAHSWTETPSNWTTAT